MTQHLEDLATLNARQLQGVFDTGVQPDLEALVGFEFRGYNEPKLTKVLGIRKFKKGFYRRGDAFFGYNVPVQQGPLAANWTCKPSDDAPKRFGFFSVKPVARIDQMHRERDAVLLNYIDGRNSLLEGRFLRDYLRQVDSSNPDLFLGKAYSSVVGRQIAPTFFIIERDREAPAGDERI